MREIPRSKRERMDVRGEFMITKTEYGLITAIREVTGLNFSEQVRDWMYKGIKRDLKKYGL